MSSITDLKFDDASDLSEVARLYTAALGRAPDAAGLSFWVGRLHGGISLPQVAQAIAASDEFASQYGGLDDAAFVQLLYQHVLDRSADPAGLAYWAGVLAQGASRQQVLLGFSDSVENSAVMARRGITMASLDLGGNSVLGEVFRLYRVALGRTPDMAGLSYWVGQGGAGMPLSQVAQSFAASAEFASSYGNLDNAAFVEQVYRNVLGRSGDASGVAFWVNLLDSGAAREQVLIGFADSPEYIGDTAPPADAAAAVDAGSGAAPTTAAAAPANVAAPQPAAAPEGDAQAAAVPDGGQAPPLAASPVTVPAASGTPLPSDAALNPAAGDPTPVTTTVESDAPVQETAPITTPPIDTSTGQGGGSPTPAQADTVATQPTAPDASAPETGTSVPSAPLQTFRDDFDTLSAGQDPGLLWRTSMEWGGAAAYTLAGLGQGHQEVAVDPAFRGVPGALAAAPLGLDPFSVQDGVLSITATALPGAALPFAGGATFASGVLTTENSFSQTYGVFEMRAELPSTTSAWPAFWLLPVNNQAPSELDVMEDIGQNTAQSHWAVHSANPGQTLGGWADTAPLSAGMHSFTAEWTPYTVTFRVDGQQVQQVATPADMNTPMYMIASLGMGGDWLGQAALTSTATLKIDSITAWQLPEYTLAGYTLRPSAAPTQSIPGTPGADTLAGTPGNDRLGGAGGADRMSGGAGDDTYVVTDPAAQVVEGYGQGIDTVLAATSFALPDNVENLTLTGSAATSATGNAQANILTGNAGANTLAGGLGNDVLTGNGGGDTFVIARGDGSDVITDFHPGAGAAHDVLQLSGLAFVSAADVLAALRQVGADVYLPLDAQDTLVLRNQDVGRFTADNVRLPGTLPTSAAPLKWVDATAPGQTLFGSGSNDQLQSSYAATTLVGGGGDDTYVVASPDARIVEQPGQGVDGVQAWSSFALPANVENLALMQGGLSGTGNAQANRLVGSAGHDVLDGKGGDDWLWGGAGNDTFVIEPGAGTATIADFHPATTTTPTPGAEHDTLELRGFGAGATLAHTSSPAGSTWTVHASSGTQASFTLQGVTALAPQNVTWT